MNSFDHRFFSAFPPLPPVDSLLTKLKIENKSLARKNSPSQCTTALPPKNAQWTQFKTFSHLLPTDRPGLFRVGICLVPVSCWFLFFFFCASSIVQKAFTAISICREKSRAEKKTSAPANQINRHWAPNFKKRTDRRNLNFIELFEHWELRQSFSRASALMCGHRQVDGVCMSEFWMRFRNDFNNFHFICLWIHFHSSFSQLSRKIKTPIAKKEVKLQSNRHYHCQRWLSSVINIIIVTIITVIINVTSETSVLFVLHAAYCAIRPLIPSFWLMRPFSPNHPWTVCNWAVVFVVLDDVLKLHHIDPALHRSGWPMELNGLDGQICFKGLVSWCCGQVRSFVVVSVGRLGISRRLLGELFLEIVGIGGIGEWTAFVGCHLRLNFDVFTRIIKFRLYYFEKKIQT